MRTTALPPVFAYSRPSLPMIAPAGAGDPAGPSGATAQRRGLRFLAAISRAGLPLQLLMLLVTGVMLNELRTRHWPALSLRSASSFQPPPPPFPQTASNAQGAGAAIPGISSFPTTTALSQWTAAPAKHVFQAPQSGCQLHPEGLVRLQAGWVNITPPFLFDSSSMPRRESACTHCPAVEKPQLCCGVCIFEGRTCDVYYPGQNISTVASQDIISSGFRLRAFSPCELFARIRGRTLWFVGDSQTWHYYYSAECFLREFAPSLRRTRPVADKHAALLTVVSHPVVVPPICLQLALGTRVCAVRVDDARTLMKQVLPTLHRLVPRFNRDLMVFNTGLHYPMPGSHGQPLSASRLVTDLCLFAGWRQRYAAQLARVIWMDIPVQHFEASDGGYPGVSSSYKCRPLDAWYGGDPEVLAGGRRNIAVASLIPSIADAHLRTWNASVPYWYSHRPDDCTHWCSPSTYHLWLYLLNDVLRDKGLGNPVKVPDRPPAAHARSAAAVAAVQEQRIQQWRQQHRQEWQQQQQQQTQQKTQQQQKQQQSQQKTQQKTQQRQLQQWGAAGSPAPGHTGG